MKKKKILIIITIIITLVIAIFIGLMIYTSTDEYIISKGYKIYGSDYCPNKGRSLEYPIKGHEPYDIAIASEIKCGLCKKKFWLGGTGASICNRCLKITNRCYKCGKLK